LEALARLLTTPRCRVEVLVDDQDQTLRLLREGRVVGCVTSSAEAVAGTSIIALGCMSYRCVATPTFAHRWFPNGLLMYNRSDRLHARYLRQRGLEAEVPHNFFPSSEGFVAFIQAGYGYGMAPSIQIHGELARGELVELMPDSELQVPLYWHRWNIQTPLTRALSDAIVETALKRLHRP